VKITITCRECAMPIITELSNKKVFIVSCDNQHGNCIVIQSNFFELFFDLACLAFLDGYYREAIFNFCSALEVFREYFIKFSLAKEGLVNELINEMWKNMSMQSERQLGAYQILCLLLNKKNTEPMCKIVKIRNDVVHKGKIPTKDEAMECGEVVFGHIRKLYSAIEIHDFLSYATLTLDKDGENFLANHNMYPTMTILFPGFQLLLAKKSSDYSFNEKLSDLSEIRHKIFQY
jgi:hypothetical protein